MMLIISKITLVSRWKKAEEMMENDINGRQEIAYKLMQQETRSTTDLHIMHDGAWKAYYLEICTKQGATKNMKTNKV